MRLFFDDLDLKRIFEHVLLRVFEIVRVQVLHSCCLVDHVDGRFLAIKLTVEVRLRFELALSSC